MPILVSSQKPPFLIKQASSGNNHFTFHSTDSAKKADNHVISIKFIHISIEKAATTNYWQL